MTLIVTESESAGATRAAPLEEERPRPMESHHDGDDSETKGSFYSFDGAGLYRGSGGFQKRPHGSLGPKDLTVTLFF
jgi:hypothetical protein